MPNGSSSEKGDGRKKKLNTTTTEGDACNVIVQVSDEDEDFDVKKSTISATSSKNHALSVAPQLHFPPT